MKYQYILNGNIVYQTDDISEFYLFIRKPENDSLLCNVLFNLLGKAGAYTINMVQAQPITDKF